MGQAPRAVKPANEFFNLSPSALGRSPSQTVARQLLIFLASGAVAIWQLYTCLPGCLSGRLGEAEWG